MINRETFPSILESIFSKSKAVTFAPVNVEIFCYYAENILLLLKVESNIFDQWFTTRVCSCLEKKFIFFLDSTFF